MLTFLISAPLQYKQFINHKHANLFSFVWENSWHVACSSSNSPCYHRFWWSCVGKKEFFRNCQTLQRFAENPRLAKKSVHWIEISEIWRGKYDTMFVWSDFNHPSPQGSTAPTSSTQIQFSAWMNSAWIEQVPLRRGRPRGVHAAASAACAVRALAGCSNTRKSTYGWPHPWKRVMSRRTSS